MLCTLDTPYCSTYAHVKDMRKLVLDIYLMGRYGLTYSLINLTRTLSIGEGDDGGAIVRKRKVIEEASTQRQNIYL